MRRLKINFIDILKKNGGVEFCTKNDMIEFYADGVKIIDFFKKKRNQYFSKKGYELVGIETELDYGMDKNIKFRGFIDLIIKDNVRNRINIIDIKIGKFFNSNFFSSFKGYTWMVVEVFFWL